MIALRPSSACCKLPIAAVLLVVGLAGESHASCGDYVAIGGGHSMAGHSDADQSTSLPSIPIAGCRGSDCQRHLPVPTGPSRDLVTVRLGERALCLALFQPPSLAPTWFASSDIRRPLDGHHRPIEHPPRQTG